MKVKFHSSKDRKVRIKQLKKCFGDVMLSLEAFFLLHYVSKADLFI